MTETKRVTAIEAEINLGVLWLTFSNGRTLEVNPKNLSEGIKADAILHGLKQKLVDAAAIARNPDTGKSATIDDKYEAVLEIYNRITSANGTWNKQRGDGAGNGSNQLVKALMQFGGKTRADVEAYLSDKSKEQKQALRQNPKIAAIIIAMQAANSSVDSDALLDELN